MPRKLSLPVLYFLFLAVPAAAQDPSARSVQAQLDEAAVALLAGRTVQARAMLSEAVAMGAAGEKIDRLLADLDFAEGRHVQALSRARQLLFLHPDDPILLERAGLSALALREDKEALAYLARADRVGTSRWRTLDGLGVLADRRGDWALAADYYDRAARAGGDPALVANNRGWSLLLQGRWEEALGPLAQAVALAPGNPRYAANLELARMAVDDDLPHRRDGEDDASFARRLNDAGVVARAQGLRTKAIAAFTRAVEANSQYYSRAADNLAALGE